MTAYVLQKFYIRNFHYCFIHQLFINKLRGLIGWTEFPSLLLPSPHIHQTPLASECAQLFLVLTIPGRTVSNMRIVSFVLRRLMHHPSSILLVPHPQSPQPPRPFLSITMCPPIRHTFTPPLPIEII